MRESTKVLMKKHGWRLDRAIHNYLYFAWYYPYVRTVSMAFKPLEYLTWLKPLKYAGNFVFSRYHSKVLSSGDTKKIFALNENINFDGDHAKKVVPFKYAHKILFTDPEFIVVMDCPCKKALGDKDEHINSCLFVGSGTGKFWLDRCKKYNPRVVSQQEALDLIRSFRKKGYITQAFFKVATGGSTGVICNCHPDTCVSLKATALTKKIDPKTYMTEVSGYSVKHDDTKCRQCGTCVQTCHFGAVSINGKGWSYDKSRCQGCELCVENCPNGAIKLYTDPDKSMPLDLDLIKEQARKSAAALQQ